jgi:phosphoglycolate phosphatase
MPDAAGLLVTDVDNTIYDWIGTWARACNAMVHVLAVETARPPSQWLALLRKVNTRRGALECPSALEDLSTEGRWTPHPRQAEILSRAAAAYRSAWDTHLTPYDGVRDSLRRLTTKDWRIVAYTESDAAITAVRLTRLGLAGTIGRVFGRSALPSPAHREWALVDTRAHVPIAVDLIPRSDMKPNPRGLRDIAARCGVPLSRTIFVGDNLWKDVAMAQRLGVAALWAAYGTTRVAADQELVDALAHWSPADVVEEDAARTRITPDRTLHTASEIANAVLTAPVAIG